MVYILTVHHIEQISSIIILVYKNSNYQKAAEKVKTLQFNHTDDITVESSLMKPLQPEPQSLCAESYNPMQVTTLLPKTI